MGFLIGIDEAGVAPVLGPMVVGGVKVGEGQRDLFKKIGVKDSKLFGSGERAIERREIIWQEITGSANFWLEKITASELDSQNWVLLEVERIAQTMMNLAWWEVDRVFIGWVGKLGEGRFLRLLSECLKRRRGVDFWELQRKIVYKKNAEEETVVAAASILAKVERDREVRGLCESAGFGYVSGYPNPKTAEFLKRYKKRYGGLPYFVRKSRNWEPLQELLVSE